jgi:DNA-binding winged helix-turn-helix (wHTH) protein/tetratricopeptide (TPR) repeat protein
VSTHAGERTVYCFRGFRLDAGQRVLERDNELVALPPKAVDILIVLAEHAGEVVDKDTIFRLVWPDTFVVDSSLTKNISLLRKTLDGDSADSAIQTVSKRGYRFTAGFEPPPAAASPATPLRFRRVHWQAVALAAALVAVVLVVYGRMRGLDSDVPVSEGERQYLIGRHMLNKAERSEMLKALARFQKAVELNPESAMAWAGVADTHAMMAVLGLGTHLAEARRAAMRAVELDPSLSLPHVSLGLARFLGDFDAAGAEREFQKAIALDPQSAAARWAYSCLLTNWGKLPAAREQVTRARQLDPVSAIIGVAAARVEYFDRRFQHAIEILQEVLEREPDFSQAHYYMAMSLGQLTRPREALDHLRQARLNPGLLETDEAWLHAIAGDDGRRARELFADRRDKVAREDAPPVTLLLPAVDAGEMDVALATLEQMVQARSIELLQLKVNPRFDPLRGDPRFTSILRRVWPE